MSDFLKSKTYRNLSNAFAGESQARNRYTYFASVADKEGYREIKEIFETTAAQEVEHAEVFYEHLVRLVGDTPSEVTVDSTYPLELGTTEENLVSAAQGENDEWTELYPQMAQDAKDEGYDEVARSYNAIIQSEKNHEKRYLALLEKVREDKVFEEDEVVTWYCMNCGYITEGKVAPKICPACKHDQKHFKRLVTWY